MHKSPGFLLALLILLIRFSAMAQKSVSIALVMPFCSKEILADPHHPDAELGNMCREYYQGMLMALDSLENRDIKIILHVYDTENDSLTMYKLMQKTSFKEPDLIIGPVLQGGNKMLTEFCKQRKIYHVSPLMTFSKTRLNDAFWISSNPELPAFAGILYRYICDTYHDIANIIVVSDKSSSDKAITSALKKITPSKNVKIKVIDYTPQLDIESYLSESLPNQVIIPSNKEQVVNASLFRTRDSATFGLNCYGIQQWFDFKNADPYLMQQKNTIIASTYFVNYLEPKTRSFVGAYRERFSSDPTEAAIKGYDQGLVYISALLHYGRSFMKDIEGKPFRMIHSTYLFEKNKDGGFYQNTYLNMLKLENNEVRRVN